MQRMCNAQCVINTTDATQETTHVCNATNVTKAMHETNAINSRNSVNKCNWRSWRKKCNGQVTRMQAVFCFELCCWVAFVALRSFVFKFVVFRISRWLHFVYCICFAVCVASVMCVASTTWVALHCIHCVCCTACVASVVCVASVRCTELCPFRNFNFAKYLILHVFSITKKIAKYACSKFCILYSAKYTYLSSAAFQ